MCPIVDKCDQKRLEALEYLPELSVAGAIQPNIVNAVAPILRETRKIHIAGVI